MKRIWEKIRNQKGAYSILSAVLILTMVTAMMGYIDILNKKWAVNEVQTIMDSSGINTLQNQVNNKALRAEIISLDPNAGNIDGGDFADTTTGGFSASAQQKYKSDMALYYQKEIDNQIKNGTNITDYNIERVDVVFSYDNWGLGETTRKLPQITLDSVVRMKVKTTGVFDDMLGVSRTMYSARNNANFTVTYNGQTDDGETELIVRSVTRLVYR